MQDFPPGATTFEGSPGFIPSAFFGMCSGDLARHTWGTGKYGKYGDFAEIFSASGRMWINRLSEKTTSHAVGHSGYPSPTFGGYQEVGDLGSYGHGDRSRVSLHVLLSTIDYPPRRYGHDNGYR